MRSRSKLREWAAHVVCVEAKLSPRWERRWERGMRDLQKLGGIIVDRMIGVSTGGRSCHFDGLDVWPVDVFLRKLIRETFLIRWRPPGREVL